MPSAAVCRAIKSTDTSRAASPSTRSRWTKTRLPALRTLAAASATVRMSPPSRKMTGTSLSRAAERPSASFTAAITGPVARRSSSLFRSMGVPPSRPRRTKRAQSNRAGCSARLKSLHKTLCSYHSRAWEKMQAGNRWFFVFWREEQKIYLKFGGFRQKSKNGLTKNCGAGTLNTQQCWKSGYLLVSLEKGVTVHRVVTPFLF